MSEETVITAPPALNDREWTLISRLNQICVIMARSKSREDVVDKVAAEYGETPAEAERWLLKAEEYMASGAIESLDVSRQMYHMRLSEIYALAMEYSVTDQVEVTSKPTKMIVVTEDGKQKEKIITVNHTKVKPNTLDTGALQVALKAARECAHIFGLRPNGGRRGVAIGTINIQNNSPGAQASHTMEMSNEMLAGMIGATVIENLEIIDGKASGSEILPDISSEAEDQNADEEGHEADETGDG